MVRAEISIAVVVGTKDCTTTKLDRLVARPFQVFEDPSRSSEMLDLGVVGSALQLVNCERDLRYGPGCDLAKSPHHGTEPVDIIVTRLVVLVYAQIHRGIHRSLCRWAMVIAKLDQRIFDELRLGDMDRFLSQVPVDF